MPLSFEDWLSEKYPEMGAELREIRRGRDLMKEKLSTREAAERLGVTILTLQRHVRAKTIDAPPLVTVGGVTVRLWSGPRH